MGAKGSTRSHFGLLHLTRGTSSFARVVDTGGKFATGVNDIDSKFAAGVNETGGDLPPVSTPLAAKI